jgi:hypothetical protein
VLLWTIEWLHSWLVLNCIEFGGGGTVCIDWCYYSLPSYRGQSRQWRLLISIHALTAESRGSTDVTLARLRKNNIELPNPVSTVSSYPWIALCRLPTLRIRRSRRARRPVRGEIFVGYSWGQLCFTCHTAMNCTITWLQTVVNVSVCVWYRWHHCRILRGSKFWLLESRKLLLLFNAWKFAYLYAIRKKL